MQGTYVLEMTLSDALSSFVIESLKFFLLTVNTAVLGVASDISRGFTPQRFCLSGCVPWLYSTRDLPSSNMDINHLETWRRTFLVM